ncbi:hypothetical protein L2E82_45275 [Cichorium intybus]|uniref:Uncharacterized protein n=1 Tax=Cichorium intybus TaxID=13427 RepID=A0ACB8ZTV4_CICIN|nr:hypothetical protein L2E82_45275 [Cichorium intybus]
MKIENRTKTEENICFQRCHFENFKSLSIGLQQPHFPPVPHRPCCDLENLYEGEIPLGCSTIDKLGMDCA